MRKRTSTIALVGVACLAAEAAAQPPPPARLRGRQCIRWDISLGAGGRFKCDVSAEVRSRLTGLGRTLAAALRGAHGKRARVFRRMARYAQKLPNDIGFFSRERAKATLDPSERAVLELVFTGKANALIQQARWSAALHRRLRVSTAKVIAEGYARAGIDVHGMPVVKVAGSTGATIYLGRTAPTRMPLMRVKAGAELLLLNAQARAGFCRVLVMRSDAWPLLAWVRCDGSIARKR